ncbi:lipid biosynthesis B12-binding/radical SAM protein [Candidatus Magnetominusculus dajiuhuensis]|uniref:lipid biosynthesis B12-binding/radical SAM protein n=1 Tax=Candidatus Magnetominusculus dajiuhuensis TaxID=3137712 RepID=UPI003B431ED5
MRKVLLISVNNERLPYPVAPIGAAYIAGHLAMAGLDVKILDLCFVDDDLQALKDSIGGFNPDIIGVSIRNVDNLTYNRSVFYMPRIRDIVNFIRTISNAPMVAGGSGFSLFPEEILRYLTLDFGVAGEGEQAFLSLIRAFENGGNIDEIPNLSIIKNGLFHQNPVSYSPVMCLPDRAVLNNAAYLQFGGMGNVQSKRGCPFKCTYCTYPMLEGSRLRLRPPEEIVAELAEMKDRHAIDYVFFVDDIFNVPAGHSMQICEGIIRKNLRIKWTCFATPFSFTEELARLMKRAGCTGIEFGSDAGATQTLNAYEKHFTPDDIAAASAICRKIDMPDAHYIIIGGPSETEETLNETFKLFDMIKPRAVIALVGVRIYPGTAICKRAVKDGVIPAVPEGKGLLEPVFYLSPETPSGLLLTRVATWAQSRANRVVPALDIHYDASTLGAIRKIIKRGPMWDVLR